MTTVAASLRERLMCSDACWTDTVARGEARKLYRIRGDVVGLAGDLGDVQHWIAAYRAKSPWPRGLNVTALRLSDGGLHVWTAPDDWVHLDDSVFAIGSGGQAARAAMMAGASCRSAVAIAIRIDAGSFGPIRSMHYGSATG